MASVSLQAREDVVFRAISEQALTDGQISKATGLSRAVVNATLVRLQEQGRAVSEPLQILLLKTSQWSARA